MSETVKEFEFDFNVDCPDTKELTAIVRTILSTEDCLTFPEPIQIMRILEIAGHHLPEVAQECDRYIQQMACHAFLALPAFSACGNCKHFDFLTSARYIGAWPFCDVKPKAIWQVVKGQMPIAYNLTMLADSAYRLVRLFQLGAFSAVELQVAIESEVKVFLSTDIKLYTFSYDCYEDYRESLMKFFAEISLMLMDAIATNEHCKLTMHQTATNVAKALGISFVSEIRACLSRI